MQSRRQSASIYQRLKQRRMRRWRWLLVLIIVGLIGGAGYGVFHWWQLRHQTMMAKYPVTGAAIDQDAGFLDFQALSKTGVKFVYLKTTVGNRYTDDDFAGNYSRSGGSGNTLKVGVYMVYSPNSSVLSQTTYFEKQVGSDTGTLPIMISVPDTGSSFGSAKAIERTVARLTAMIATLRTDYQQPVLLWTSTDGYQALKGKLSHTMFSLDDSKLAKRSPQDVQFISYDDNGSLIVAGERQSMSLMVYNGSKQSFDALSNE
ncbi:GH25 family lysozyme [Furfurilactobacillus milii]|uniref:Lysozyme n=1 Tax=Furfurilactobacillus milii TaxID=2888272 RepID=A0A6N9I037_9LACO|nr:hypothetical protein [Furfurilactobacillus milii]